MIKDFPNRHIGPRDDQIQEMLSEIGFSSLEDLSKKVIPPNIVLNSKMDLPNKMSEPETINRFVSLLMRTPFTIHSLAWDTMEHSFLL